MFDIILLGDEPFSLFAHAKRVTSIMNARSIAKTKSFWLLDSRYDYTDFDFTWLPDAWEEHVTHVFPLKSQFDEQFKAILMPKYQIEEITCHHDTQVIQRYANKDYWHLVKPELNWIIDDSWAPDPYDPPYIHVFGNKWYSSRVMPTIEYRVPGATAYKYRTEQILSLPLENHWVNLVDNVDVSALSEWEPNPFEPPFIYVFGNQWHSAEVMPTVEYHVPGATDRKYINDLKVTLLPSKDNWVHLIDNVDMTALSGWTPNPYEDPYIYVFGNQWHPAEVMPTVEYRVPGATDRKYINDINAQLMPSKDNWVYLVNNIDTTTLDSWTPDPFDPPFIYVFGNQWHPAEVMPTVEYRVPGATDRKYINDIKVTLLSSKDNWAHLVENVDVSPVSGWTPDPFDPPFIYVFGNQWHPAEVMPTIEYYVPGATDRKYINDVKVTLLPSTDNWVYLTDNVDTSSLDGWLPSPYDPPLIYVFGNQWYPAEVMPTIEYHVPGATDKKYINDIKVTLLPSKDNWVLLVDNVDTTNLNSWLPNPYEDPYIYVFGNQWYPAEIMPTVEYRVPGATDRKYINDIKVTLLPSTANWVRLADNVDMVALSGWVPNPYDPPLIYVFGNQWYPAEVMPTIEYHVPGATDRKYINDIKVTLLPSKDNWTHLIDNVDTSTLDSWVPNPHEDPYIYVFGNQWYTAETMPTIEYHVPGAIDRKYINDIKVTLLPSADNWVYLIDNVDSSTVDNWIPNPHEDPYIYVFGNQWYPAEVMPTVEYHVPGATDRKYINDIKVTLLPSKDNWTYLVDNVDMTALSGWVPNPFDPPLIYVFGNQWYTAETMPTVEYHVPGAIDRKYINDIKVTLLPSPANWVHLVDNVDATTLDSWLPNPYEDPYIYVFGNQWYSAEVMPTVEYRVPGATDRKYINDIKVTLLPSKDNWTIPEEVDEDKIDFSWIPNPHDDPFIYHFGTEFQQSVGLIYSVPAATELKFISAIPLKAEVKTKTAIQTVNIFFVDMNNKLSAKRFDALKEKYPAIQKIRFINGWMETVKRCLARTETIKFWVISSENVYDDFNFEWHPQPWQNQMTHVFASQWQQWSDTYLINKYEFERHIKWAKSLTELPNLNFVNDQPVYRPDDLNEIYYIDHHNPNVYFDKLKKRYPDIKVVDFTDSYLTTLKHIVPTAKSKFIWVTSSYCDYSRFDFTWQTDPWQRGMLHVFPTNDQQFGDTFYVNVNKFIDQMDITQLIDYDSINYCNDQMVPRLPFNVVTYDEDSVADVIKTYKFTESYTVFKHKSIIGELPKVTPSLWTKQVHQLSNDGAVIISPSIQINSQVYDFPYITNHALDIKSTPLDIVYLSNGEPDEQKWYDHLIKCAGTRKVHWIRGVNGRTNAYKEAARVSTTPWFFTIFAKLEVMPDFNWDWKPDFMQEPKHYIFNALNPVNGLQYGHQACIAYNKKLVLQNDGTGIDFTLSQKHESVNMLSGIAHFNQSPWMTWRTAFREVIKLKLNNDQTSNDRLNTWLTVENSDFGDWSIKGAIDGLDFYQSVNGNLEQLLQSYEWDWLQKLFNSKYN